MKRILGTALMLVLVSGAAFAAQKSQSVTIPEKMQVGSTAIPAGDYKLTYTGTGPVVQVTLAQEKKAPITFSAKTVAGKFDPGVNTDSRTGVVVLQSIQLKSVSLVIADGTAAGQQ
jgi:hypothetical protein